MEWQEKSKFFVVHTELAALECNEMQETGLKRIQENIAAKKKKSQQKYLREGKQKSKAIETSLLGTAPSK